MVKKLTKIQDNLAATKALYVHEVIYVKEVNKCKWSMIPWFSINIWKLIKDIRCSSSLLYL